MRSCREIFVLSAIVLLFAGCTTKDTDHRLLISVADQAVELYHRSALVGRYLVSTSKFGLGDRPGSRATPLGRMEVAKKIGAGAQTEGATPPSAVGHTNRPRSSRLA